MPFLFACAQMAKQLITFFSRFLLFGIEKWMTEKELDRLLASQPNLKFSHKLQGNFPTGRATTVTHFRFKSRSSMFSQLSLLF